MKTLADWIEKGLITLRVLTVGTFIICARMWWFDMPFPETLSYTWKIILPFWFGTEGLKVAFEAAKDAYEKEHEAHMKHHKEDKE